MQFTKRDTVTDTNEVSANVNASYNLGTEIPISFKTGLDTVNRRVNNRQVSPRRWNRNADPAGPAGAQIPLRGFALMPLTRFEERNAPAGQRIPIFDPVDVSKELSNPQLWTEDFVYAAQQPYVNRRIFEEAVDAGYLQGQAKFGRLNVLGGVRVEDVNVDTFTYIRYRTLPVAAEPDPVRRSALEYGESAREGGYTKTFPSVHLAYDITNNLKARASWSTSYGRPTLAQMVAGTTWNDQNQTVTSGNPSVGPQMAKNLDLKLEYYFKNNGVLTVSGFEKKITDYILNATLGEVPSGPDNGYEGNFAGYTLIGPRNAGDAKVRGFELDFRQRLAFLPGALKGLVFAANYTWIKTTGRFTGATPIATNDVPGFIPRTGNARLVYNYKRFGASASVNFTGEHISAVSALTPIANRLYRKDLYRVNMGVSYKWRPDVQFYADVSNIFEEGITTYRYIPSRIRQEIWAGRTVNIGVSGQF
jgi:TonB-dependent receptor